MIQPQRNLFGPPSEVGDLGTFGKYRILKELGRGGMGAVFVALDSFLNRKVALKLMLPEVMHDQSAQTRFIDEARAVAQISHINVVKIYEAGLINELPYFTMELLNGCSLDYYLRNKGLPNFMQVVRIALETCRGLKVAHEKNLIHRDIKPANIWLESPKGRIKILDFGLAKPISTNKGITSTGGVVGTPAFMSPEQALGTPLDARSDLYSLGTMLYLLCTGHYPFEGKTSPAVMVAIISGKYAPIATHNSAVPQELVEFIDGLMQHDPAKRIPSADAAIDQLIAIVNRIESQNTANTTYQAPNTAKATVFEKVDLPDQSMVSTAGGRGESIADNAHVVVELIDEFEELPEALPVRETKVRSARERRPEPRTSRERGGGSRRRERIPPAFDRSGPPPKSYGKTLFIIFLVMLLLFIGIVGALYLFQDNDEKDSSREKAPTQATLSVTAPKTSSSAKPGVPAKSVVAKSVPTGAFLGVVFSECPEGMKLNEVIPYSPAANAGLKTDDIITRYDGHAIAGMKLAEFKDIIATSPLGTRLQLEALRDGSSRQFQVLITGRTLAGQYHLSHSVNNKLKTSVWHFEPYGKVNQFRPSGDTVQKLTGKWSHVRNRLTIDWDEGARENGNATFNQDGNLEYQVVSHPKEPEFVGQKLLLNEFHNPGLRMGVLNIDNKLDVDLVFDVRFIMVTPTDIHMFNVWKEYKLPARKSYQYWLAGAYLAQIKFDSSMDAGEQEKRYLLPVDIVEKQDKPAQNQGRNFEFVQVGTTGIDMKTILGKK
ncbi:MAG: protein kinase [Zavarzinella sp.]